MTRRLLSVLAALMLLLAACGDDDDTAADQTVQDDPAVDDTAQDDATEDDTGGTTSSTVAGSDGGQAAAAVSIAGFAFEPPSIEVAAGDTVTWTNEDGVSHTVTAGAPGSAEDAFDESLDAGATAEITFDEAGTFAYFCAIHPSMTGEVVVS